MKRLTFIGFLQMALSISTNHGKVLEVKCECGLKNHDSLSFESRGIFSESHAWPWMAAIVNATNPYMPVAYCGGTLINDRYILTAAHCVPDMLTDGVKNFRVYLGTNVINSGSEFLDLGIRKIITHFSFDYDSADNDLSLFKLSEPVIFNNFIRPICLRQHARGSYVGETASITGWGSYNLTESTENQLKEAEAVVVTNEVCAQNYSSEEIPITDNMLCASLTGEADPCKGDSGGPLVWKDPTQEKESYTQIGIISHGQGCGVPNYPSIFTRVSNYIRWIKDHTRDGIYCEGSFSS